MFWRQLKTENSDIADEFKYVAFDFYTFFNKISAFDSIRMNVFIA